MILHSIGDPHFFQVKMNGRLRTWRTRQVKRTAGHLRSLTVLRSLQFRRCIPPALDRLTRRYSQGTISPWKKWGSPMLWSPTSLYAKI